MPVTAVDVPTDTILVAEVDEFQKVALQSPGGTTKRGTVLPLDTVICPIT
jgi:hypothetical protein